MAGESAIKERGSLSPVAQFCLHQCEGAHISVTSGPTQSTVPSCRLLELQTRAATTLGAACASVSCRSASG